MSTTVTGSKRHLNINADEFAGDLNGTVNTATTATTQSTSDNSTKVATTAFVKAQGYATGTIPTFSTVGAAFRDLGDVSVVSYVRVNADETLSYLNAAQFLSAIGGTGNTGTVTSVGTGNIHTLSVSGTTAVTLTPNVGAVTDGGGNLATGDHIYDHVTSRISGYATESYVDTSISSLVDSAPGTLNTLNELADALGDDANFSTTVTNSIATKLPLAGGTMSGAINMGNSNITGVNAIQFADPGPSEGVTWTNTKIYESPNDLTTNTSGNLQLVYNNTRRLTVDSGGIDVNGNIVVSGTVDGVDIATRDSVLTSTTTTANAALPKSGGTMTGDISLDNNDINFTCGSITSDGTTFAFDGAGGKEVLISSARDVRVVIDDNNDDTDNTFEIHKHSFAGGNELLTLNQSGNLVTTGTITGTTLTGTSLDINGNADISGSTTVADITANGHIYGRNVNGEYSNLYRMGGIYFTWDSDSYGTNFDHSITSTSNGNYGDNLTMNSYGKVRINFDSNNNDSADFSIGHHTTGTANTLLTLNDSGNLTITGELEATALDINGNADISGTTALGGKVTITSTSDSKLNLRTTSGDSSEWNYIDFTGTNGTRDAYIGTNSNGSPLWNRDDGNVSLQLNSNYINASHRLNVQGELEATSLDINGNADISGVLSMAPSSGIPINITGTNSSYTAIAVKNTGTGNAGVYFDAINGDLSGSDYGFVGQNNSGYMEYHIGGSSPQAYHDFDAQVKVAGELEATSLDINGDGDVSGTLTVATISATNYGLASADIPNNAANTTGTAASSAKLTDGGTLTTQPGTNNLIYTGQISAGTSGLFATSDNSNSIITLNRHSGNYDSQLGFSSNGNLYYRKFSNAAINTTQVWKVLAFTDNANMLNSNVTLSSLGAAASSHNHDDRYYTETEIDAFGFLTSSSTQSKYLRSDEHDTTGFTITSSNGLGFKVDSAGSGRIEIESTNNWSYLRLQDNNTTSWDIASYDGGQLEWRPAGSATNRMTYTSGGVLTTGDGFTSTRGNTAYSHSQAAHAPSGATVNSSDATLLARANHTGTQTASTISDFDTEVANNSAVTANTAKVSNIVQTSVSGSSGSCTGNAATATLAATSTIASDTGSATHFPVFVDGSTGARALKSHSSWNYNPGTSTLTAGKLTTDTAAIVENAKSNAALMTLTGAGAGNEANITLKLAGTVHGSPVKMKMVAETTGGDPTGNGLLSYNPDTDTFGIGQTTTHNSMAILIDNNDVVSMKNQTTFTNGIDVTSAVNSTSKTTGTVKVAGGVGIVKTLNVGEDVVAYASSDERYKDNLKPITNPIDKVKSLTGYTFTWNDKHDQFNGNDDIGVVAQEVEKVFPEIVDTRDNGYKAVKYEKMVAVLIEAIKDQQKQIDKLKQMCNGCSK